MEIDSIQHRSIAPTHDEMVYPLFMKNKLEIEGYFSDKELIKILCRKRAVAAKKVHNDHFLRNISKNANSPHAQLKKEIFSFFPPRNSWIRLNKHERKIRGLNALDMNVIQLERTVWREIKKCNRLGSQYPEWLQKLLDLIEKIRTDVLDEKSDYKISKPKIIPVLKDKKENTYRPITVFQINDSIIISQVSNYLSNCLNPLFSDSSYAFRIQGRELKEFNHHRAIEDIIEFRLKTTKSLFVTECDIKKFYDCLNHSTIKEEFQLITNEAKESLQIPLNSRAIQLFESYLSCFSFNNEIKNKEGDLLNAFGILNGTIPWVDEYELLDVKSNPKTDRIGVPQGGAISCLISNIVLTPVDRAIEANSDKNTFYARFCDDMVLMHTNKKKCESLLRIYQSALKDVKLISHRPLGFSEYGKEFWDENIKSKLPYKWAINYTTKDCTKKNVPWLSFVGYQIRYDGVIRVRNKSIKKELKKQVSETDKIIKLVKKLPRINSRAIKFRLHQRLISMSVGRVRFGLSNNSMCWCAGFKALKSKPNLTNQIRRLDRNREKQIKRLELFLRDVKTPNRKVGRAIKTLKHYGHNYSYHKQFTKK